MKRSILSAVLLVSLVGCRSTTPAQSQAHPTTLATTQGTTLQAKLDSILNRLASTGAVVSARVIDPETKRELFAQDAGRPVVPASNMKLTVTSAALDFFGPTASFDTDLYVVGQDLYLVGHGDPGTGDGAILKKSNKDCTAVLDAWADELAARGVTSLAGNLYYVDNAFERLQTHPSWDEDDKTEWYAAPVGGLNFNDNCIDGIATPTSDGQPAKIEIVPATSASVVLVNQTTSGGEQTADWSRAEGQNVYTAKGGVTKRTQLQSKPVTDPGSFFADALRTRLAEKGIKIAGATARAERLPTGTSTKLKPATTKFTDILARINKNSQNMMAEGTAKLLGRAHAIKGGDAKAVGSWSNADTAIRAYWQKEGIDASGFTFADGSGLSRDNRVTTRLISDILVSVYHSPNFDTFRESMSIAGVDGTTRARLSDKPNRVYCKTGYISGVRSLSGYAKTDSGKWVVFSIIYNKIPGRGATSTKPYEQLQDEAVRVMMAE